MIVKKSNTLIAIIIIAGLFFIFGFVTWINGALIPFMKTINELTDAQSYLVASASYISFVVMALPASYILNKIGYTPSTKDLHDGRVDQTRPDLLFPGGITSYQVNALRLLRQSR